MTPDEFREKMAAYKAKKSGKSLPEETVSISAPESVTKHSNRPDGTVAKFPRQRFLDFLTKLKIQSKDSGVVAFEMLGSQVYILDEIIEGLERGVATFIILKSRQLGASTFFLALDLFWAFEYPGRVGVFATHEEGSRDLFRNQIDVFLEGLPQSHKVNKKTNNRLMLVLKNLSVFRYLIAGTKTTTNKLGRSGGCNFCHATEVAFWGSEDDLDSLMDTFSELNPHRMYIFESTANGFNHFQEIWEIALDSPAQKGIFVGWWRDERNELSLKNPLYLHYMPEGVKTQLTALEKDRIKKVRELYNFDITAGQVAWYRYHLENKKKGNQSAMDQEQPWVPEDAFISTGSGFYSSKLLTEVSKEARQHFCMPFMIRINNDFESTQIIKVNDTKQCDLKIWEMPKPGAKYVIGADPIFGSDDTRDNGVISIGRCYADCIVQVAEYTCDSVSTYQFAWVIAFLAGLYVDVYLVLEMTGPGAVVFEELKQLKQKLSRITPGVDDDIRNCLRHMKNFMYTRSDSLSPTYFLQWKTSGEIRTQMLNLFHDGIATGRFKPRSMLLIDEMRYQTIDGGYISSPPSKTDDRIFGSGLVYWGWDRTIRRRLWQQKGMTLIETQEREEKGDITQISSMAQRYLQNAKIDVQE